MSEQERARDDRARSSAGRLVQRRAVVLHRAAQPADAERRRAAPSSEDDRRVPEREEEADAQRALALVHELARRVVDRADVVGVEGVAQPERVGGDPHARGRRRRRAEAIVVRDDEREQEEEADDVQAEDDRRRAGRARRHSAGVRAPRIRLQRERPASCLRSRASANCGSRSPRSTPSTGAASGSTTRVTLTRSDLTLFHQPIAAKILGGGTTITLGELMYPGAHQERQYLQRQAHALGRRAGGGARDDPRQGPRRDPLL